MTLASTVGQSLGSVAPIGLHTPLTVIGGVPQSVIGAHTFTHPLFSVTFKDEVKVNPSDPLKIENEGLTVILP